MKKQNELKEDIIKSFLQEIKNIDLGVSETSENTKLVIGGNTKFIRLNPEVNLKQLNTFAKGSNLQYESFIDFFIEYYSLRITSIIKKVAKLNNIASKEIVLPIISFSPTENDTILINT